jgi:hypothetical protein
MLAQTAADAGVGKRGKKKKGVKLDLSSLQELGSEQCGRPQMPQQQQPSPAAMQRQQRQQQQQQAPVSMADFPSLDEAATAQAAGDDTPLEKDYLVEALNKLKLGESREEQRALQLLVQGLHCSLKRE